MNNEDEESVPVNCSFCGKQIECPANMLKSAEKHACFECFTKIGDTISDADLGKIHVDMPAEEGSEMVAGQIAEEMVGKVFPELWAEHKEELKEMSKKDLAREMFAEGAFNAAVDLIDMFSRGEWRDDSNEEEDEKQKDM
jgi:hypothetical protein